MRIKSHNFTIESFLFLSFRCEQKCVHHDRRFTVDVPSKWKINFLLLFNQNHAHGKCAVDLCAHLHISSTRALHIQRLHFFYCLARAHSLPTNARTFPLHVFFTTFELRFSWSRTRRPLRVRKPHYANSHPRMQS